MNAINPEKIAGAETAEPSEPDTGAVVLVVDDVADNRDILTRRLVRRGFEAIEASGGAEALAVIESKAIDVVLLDIMMPDISGTEVLRTIRETRDPTELPVIMVSAKSESVDVVESLQIGANDYVTKPVDFAVALARITTQVARKKAADKDRAHKRNMAEEAQKLSLTVEERNETLRRATQTLEAESRQRAKSEERLRYLAFHDGLTGLLNRTAFSDAMRENIASANAEGRDIALLFVDLDHFKAVNDVHGHEAGDRLLREVAQRMRDFVGERGVVARLGGDEFAVLLTANPRRDEAEVLAVGLVERLSERVEVGEQIFQVGASSGMSWLSDCDGLHESLMKAADLAMYRAKNGGRNRNVVYEPMMLVEHKARSLLEVDLRAAISSDELELHFQPLVNASSGKITSFEALVRWNHPERGMIAPGAFIPLAEETGLIIPLGAWVLRRACMEAAKWPSDIRVAVNLSPLQFRDGTLLHTMRQALADSQLDPKRLEMEITESALLESGDHNFEILNAIRKLGVRISVDDFGTGYSSMAYLQQFVFDKIKIDRRFVAGLNSCSNSAAIMRAIVQLGINIGIETTAEGIETEEQLVAVTEHGCTEVQGFYFTRPLNAEDARVYLNKHLSSNGA